MDVFPKKAKFCFPWRPYQAAVLAELESHLDDNHLNIVAAPGAGKTVLGLEVMLRINKPTLILAPSIAIRNQWIERFTVNFLQVDKIPDWISDNIKYPKFLTVSTYQGLHAAFTNQNETTNYEEGTEEPETEIVSEANNAFVKADVIIKKLKTKHIQTIIVDEAHHLRNEWWKSLIYLRNSIENIHIVALTATPPYDVSPQEWKNYQNLCGPIDAEISVPELVAVKNLCPHQDYVLLNSPSVEEDFQVQTYRKNVESFLTDLKNNIQLTTILESHPYLLSPQKHTEAILENPAYFSSILIYLNKRGVRISKNLRGVLGISNRFIPNFSIDWAEILLQNFLYKDTHIRNENEDFVTSLERQLKRIGALEKKNVLLKNNTTIKRLLRDSLNKLESILTIVKVEQESLKENLRMVILTDYIRSEFFPISHEIDREINRIGVVPIFEKLRREFSGTSKIGILSGSIVVLPNTAEKILISTATRLGIPETHLNIKQLRHDERFITVKIKGEQNDKIVHLITEIFTQGEVQILVGTKSLLGEGWDAPSINTLILASFVGSFMLSNQMRGRAIRIDKANPEKISNIWHLATVETNNLYAGHDFEMLTRRFKAFVGISVTENSIESGLERMNISIPPFSDSEIVKYNAQTILYAIDRNATQEKWFKTLEGGEIKKIIPEIKTKKDGLPRNFIFYNTIYALFWRSVMSGVYLFLNFVQGTFDSSHPRRNYDIETLLWLFGFMIIVSLAVSLPGLLKSLFLFLRNGPITGNMRQIGNVLIKTLCKFNIIKTELSRLRVIAKTNKYGVVFCRLEGGTTYEKSVFLDCLEEIVEPIENPRYILVRKSRFNFWLREDFHTIPKIIGIHKKSAAYFALMWGKYVGPNKLIFTRNLEGRKLLLKARQKALSTSFQKRSERIDTWQ